MSNSEGKDPTEITRDNKQVENLKYTTKNTGRYTRDGRFNMHELAFDGQDFVWHIQTYPDMEIVCGHIEMLQEASMLYRIERTSYSSIIGHHI